MAELSLPQLFGTSVGLGQERLPVALVVVSVGSGAGIGRFWSLAGSLLGVFSHAGSCFQIRNDYTCEPRCNSGYLAAESSV